MHIFATPLHWPVWSQANRYTTSAKKMVSAFLAHTLWSVWDAHDRAALRQSKNWRPGGQADLFFSFLDCCKRSASWRRRPFLLPVIAFDITAILESLMETGDWSPWRQLAYCIRENSLQYSIGITVTNLDSLVIFDTNNPDTPAN